MRVVETYVVFECDKCKIVRGSMNLKDVGDRRFKIDFSNDTRPKGFSMFVEDGEVKLYCSSCSKEK